MELDALKTRLQGLSKLLGQATSPAGEFALRSSRATSPPKPAPPSKAPARSSGANPARAPPFKPSSAASSSILRTVNHSIAGVGPALERFKEEEAKWLQQKGELQLMLNREKKRTAKLEVELKRAQEMHQYRVGEVKHLKAALKQRDGSIIELRDRVRELELSDSAEKLAREVVQQAEAERDELRGAMQEMLTRLSRAHEVIAQTDQTISDMEAKVQAVEAERQEAAQQADIAAAEAAARAELVRQLQWKCGMLQQLADLTLQQNEQKMAALRELLQSESKLDADKGDEEGSAAEDGLLGLGGLPLDDEEERTAATTTTTRSITSTSSQSSPYTN